MKQILSILIFLIIPIVYAGTYEELSKKFDDSLHNSPNLTITIGKEIIKEDIKNGKYNELLYHYVRIGDAYLTLRRSHDHTSNLSALLENYGNAEELTNRYYNNETIGQEFFAQFYANYGLNLLLNKNYSSSEKNLLLSYNISSKLNNTYGQEIALTNLGRLWSEVGEYEKVIWSVKERERLGIKVKNKDYILNFARAMLNESSNIEFKETWYIKPTDTSNYYQVLINLNLVSNYKLNFTYPLIDWSFHYFKPINNFTIRENDMRIGMELIEANFKWENPSLETIREKAYPLPQPGRELNRDKISDINISFIYPKQNINIFASKSSILVKGLRTNYQKLINIYTNDEFFSVFPSDSDVHFDHYNMSINKSLIGVKPTEFRYPSHNYSIYFPYINSEDSFGTIFGMIKPTSKRIWLKEDIILDEVNEGKLKGDMYRTERLDFQNDAKTKYFDSRLFFVGDNLRDIIISPINNIIIEAPISFKLNEYEPNYEKNQAYISNKEGGTRYLFFWIDVPDRVNELKINYPIDLSNNLIKINQYTWILDYTNLFYPGKFPSFDRQYKFILPKNYKILESSPEAEINQNEIIFYFEEDFKLKEKVSFTFKNLTLEYRFHKKLSTFLLIVVSILLFMFSFRLHKKYGLAVKYIIDQLIQTIISAIFSFVFLEKILYWASLIIVIVYTIFLIFILSLNENRDIRKRIFKF